MEFFIPAMDTDKKRDEAWKVMRKVIGETSDRKIFKIIIQHKGKKIVEEVGQKSNIVNETILAIFETDIIYYVCTPKRGGLTDMPIMLGNKQDIYDIEDFED